MLSLLQDSNYAKKILENWVSYILLEPKIVALNFSTELLIFSRFPRLGKVKTRLSTILAPETCLALHNALLLDTLDRILMLRGHLHLFLADCSLDDVETFTQTMGVPTNISIHRQEGNDLGQRMWNAYRKVSRKSKRVLFLGSDTPSLPLGYVQQALKKLDHFPVVIGPSDDGGYYLLAISQEKKRLFENIDWGTETVLEQTLSRLNKGEYWLLPRWYDIDRDFDLEKLGIDLQTHFKGFPQRTKRFWDCLQQKRALEYPDRTP